MSRNVSVAMLCLALIVAAAGCTTAARSPETPTGVTPSTGVEPPVVTPPEPPPSAPETVPPTEAETSEPSPGAASGVYTPAKGSSERQAMMDAMRNYLGRQDLVFVVDLLKVKGDWAFAQVRPETRDGAEKLEGLDFLLKGAKTAWGVKAAMGLNGEDDWQKYEAAGSVRAYWVKQFPSAPPAIFPSD